MPEKETVPREEFAPVHRLVALSKNEEDKLRQDILSRVTKDWDCKTW